MSRGAVGDPPQTHHPIRDAWPLLLGFAALAIPTAVSLGEQEWTRDYGAHEPIVLLIGGWLIWRQRRSIGSIARAGHWLPTSLALLAALPTYGFGRAFDFPTLEMLGLVRGRPRPASRDAWSCGDAQAVVPIAVLRASPSRRRARYGWTR